MDIKERQGLNKAKLEGIVQRIQSIDQEKQELLQEALRLDGENRLLDEQIKGAANDA
ncbi:MAG: hypothetical protein JW901_09850 [Dehalococcoidia bacterium]|nr:hypothetical protein [Dehalococcoidia bacterium]